MRAALPVLFAGLMSVPAAAMLPCLPVEHRPKARPVAGEACAQEWRVDRTRIVALGQAVDLGDGRALQYVIDGDSCAVEHHVLVHDCAAGRAAVIGPETYVIGEGDARRTPLGRAVAAIRKAGAGLTLGRVAAEGRRAGMTTIFTLAVTDRLSVNGKRLRIDCVCRTMPPAAEPAR